MSGITDVTTKEQRPAEPDRPPAQRRASPGQWLRDNLFSSPLNSAITLVFGALLAWALVKAAIFVFVSSDWSIIDVNLTNLMVGRFPRDQFPRLWAAIFVLSAVVGANAGVMSQATPGWSWRQVAPRYVPLALLLVVLLWFPDTVLPRLLTGVAVAVAGLTYLGGGRLPDGAKRRMGLVSVAGLVVAYAICTAAGGVGYAAWGGLLLTLFLAGGAITLSFPLGVLLGLGRRSSLPAVRVVCVGYIELIRGVPLITVLFMGFYMLQFIYPDFVPTPQTVTRALVAFILFTAAYVAEIVRGGLQGVPKGQVEAAQALGLSPIKITRLIVLPQALRSVIPALVGQFISLFKDTSLISILGVLELLLVAQVITSQPGFLARGYEAQTLTFAAFVYWAFCYTMSRASQRLEARLGVGER